MKAKLFFDLAKKAGINECEIKQSLSTSISVELLNGEIDSYNISEEKSIRARGIVNGKFGAGRTNIEDKNTAQYLVDTILSSGRYLETDEEAILFKGSKKYAKGNTYNKELNNVPLETKLANLDIMHKFAKEFDPRIETIAVSYSEGSSIDTVENSYGLKLSSKDNSFTYGMFVTVRDENGEVVNASDYFLDNKFENFDPIEFAKNVSSAAISKLHPTQCKSKKYKVLLNQKVFGRLLGAFISNLSSEEVQKNSSVLGGKLGEQIASTKLTIEERPLDKTLFFNAYDSECVATYNKTLIKKGVLQTYLYNLATAKKENRESTGNGYGGGNKIGIGFVHLVVKKGKKSFDQLLEKVNNGIYITEIMGLHAGLNAKSGDFSLQAQGYMIENGKQTSPLSQIVVAGNLFDLVKNVTEVGSDLKLLGSSAEVPSVIVKNVQVNGK